ncbi:MAG: RloB family protein [Vampirovibrionales bacterium]|jgi:hypothetical protein|nr:RloB family protein [Vampirovibrionales bacterium]
MARKKDNNTPKQKKPIKPYVLCLTEGENTERLYLIYALKAETHSIKIEKSECSNALGIVKEAIRTVNRLAERIDRLYAVFDREFCGDQTEGGFLHSFSQIDQKLKNEKYQNIIIPVFSNPSIEYVLLLHFKESNRPYSNNSEIMQDLKKECPSYSKAEKDSICCFKELRLEQVKNASQRLKKQDNSLSFTKETTIRDRAYKDHMPNSNFYVLIDALTNQKT